MLKLALVVTLNLFLSSTYNTTIASERECLMRLTHSYAQDSRNFQLNLDEIDIRDYGRDYLAKAIKVIRLVIAEVGCVKKDINFGKGPFGRSRSRCSQVVSLNDESRVCYVESNLGYWFVTYDYQDRANIIFNRWD